MKFENGIITIKEPKLLRHAYYDNNRQPCSEFLCDCGVLFVTRNYQVFSGKAKSCGCLAKFVRALNVQKIKYSINVTKDKK